MQWWKYNFIFCDQGSGITEQNQGGVGSKKMAQNIFFPKGHFSTKRALFEAIFTNFNFLHSDFTQNIQLSNGFIGLLTTSTKIM